VRRVLSKPRIFAARNYEGKWSGRWWASRSLERGPSLLASVAFLLQLPNTPRLLQRFYLGSRYQVLRYLGLHARYSAGTWWTRPRRPRRPIDLSSSTWVDLVSRLAFSGSVQGQWTWYSSRLHTCAMSSSINSILETEVHVLVHNHCPPTRQSGKAIKSNYRLIVSGPNRYALCIKYLCISAGQPAPTPNPRTLLSSTLLRVRGALLEERKISTLKYMYLYLLRLPLPMEVLDLNTKWVRSATTPSNSSCNISISRLPAAISPVGNPALAVVRYRSPCTVGAARSAFMTLHALSFHFLTEKDSRRNLRRRAAILLQVKYLLNYM
jgi:hypothetical protein